MRNIVYQMITVTNMSKPTVIHNRIPLELYEFIERQAETRRFYNKTDVVINALMELKDQLEPTASH